MGEPSRSAEGPPAKISRRQLLQAGAGAGLGMFGLASMIACSPAAQPSPTAAPASTKASAPAPTTAPAAAASTAAPTAIKRVSTDDVASSSGPLAGQTIKMAGGGPMTGDQARFGLEIQYALEWVADKVNAKGGVLGAKIGVLTGDDQHNPKLGEVVAQKFVDDPDVMGVIGHVNSAVQLPVTVIYNKANLASIGGTVSNPLITERGLAGVFRLGSRDDYSGTAAAVYAVETVKAKKMAAVDDQSTFGKGGCDELEKKLKKSYPDVALTRAAIKPGDKDFRPVLGSLPKDIQALYYGGYAPEGAQIAKQMQEVGLAKVQLLGIDALYQVDDFIKAAGGAAEGAVVFALAPPTDTVPEAATFVKDQEQRLGGLSSYSNIYYDAALILLTAIKKVGKKDRAAITAEVAKTCDFYGYSTKEPICFDTKGDNKNAGLFVYKVKNDAFVLIDTVAGAKLMG